MANLNISPGEQESTRSEPLPSLSEDSFEENDVFSEAAEITNGFSETL